MLPSGVAASARGVSPNSSMIVSGVPPSAAPRSAASKTHTSARGVPGVVSAAGTDAGRFWPRRAVVMKARGEGAVASVGPAKTMSRGSSPTSSVRTTRGGSAPTSTMLTLSDRWLTTHTSPSVRAATATGSSPTGTDPTWVRPPPSTAKISSRSSGVFDREQPRAVRRQRQRPHLAALEGDEGGRGTGRRQEEPDDECGDEERGAEHRV